MTDDDRSFPAGPTGPVAGSVGEDDDGPDEKVDVEPVGPSSTILPSSSADTDGTGTSAKHHGSFLRELPILIAVALILALLIKAFLVQAFYIPSGSMENTLHVGDRVLVNKLIYRFRDIHRGEVVVFNGDDTSFQPEVTYQTPSNFVVKFFRSFASAIGIAPPGEKDFIKRVIGVGGDKVVCCDKQGRVTVNGTPLNEPYLYPRNSPSDQDFSVVVPKDHIWVMGDHRAASQDSRAYIDSPGGGFVPTSKVIGRAFVIVWPPSHAGTLPVPETFNGLAADVLEPTTAAPALVLGGLGAVPVGLLRRRRRRRRRAAGSSRHAVRA